MSRRVAELDAAGRPLTRLGRIGRKGGVSKAISEGLPGNSHWGHQMLGRRGGLANARRNLEQLRRMSPGALRLANIARERNRARRQWELEHGETPTKPPGSRSWARAPWQRKRKPKRAPGGAPAARRSPPPLPAR